MTPGCTVEANDFTKLAKSFEKAGAVVIGVSKDPVQRLDTFKEKEGLSVILASDEDVTIAKAYGVWGEKSLYGRKFMGIERATFLIDGAGVVRRLWRKVKVKGHAEEVLQAVRTP